MDSKEQLSAKKKKDLVEIAVHFGILSLSKANAMTKAALVEFLSNQNSQTQPDNDAPASVEPTADADIVLVSENLEAAKGEESADVLTLPEEKQNSPKKRQTKSVSKTTSRSNKSTSKRSKTSKTKQKNTSGEISNNDDIKMSDSALVIDNKISDQDKDFNEHQKSKDKDLLDDQSAQRKSKSRRRSIIIQPKDPLPDVEENPVADDLVAQTSDQSEVAEDKNVSTPRTLKVKEPEPEMITGVLEIMPDGFGFIRRDNYLPSNSDIFIHSNYIRRFGLRTGDLITGPVRPKKPSDKYAPLQYIKEVNEQPPEKMLRRPHFEKLTPIYPNERFVLETQKTELSTRIIDLIAPIGKGQRGMIVSPPKAGKTILLQKIANAISINNPDAKLIVLLIDERPEEVTDMQRSINGEVVYSTFDKKPENHTKIVELVLERAMRLVEIGQDVVILLDSMTRLSRAYNLTINPTGRTLSGGLDPGALYGPKRFFGAARNIENGGSLTIIATSLIETGSRMDEVIFEEFKGTGNMEVYLDRKLSEKRIFPAIDINKSGTRREDLLLQSNELDAVWTIRKAFSQLDTSAVTEMIISLLLKTQTNQQFVQSVNVSFNDKALFDAMRGGARPAGTSSTSNGNGK